MQKKKKKKKKKIVFSAIFFSTRIWFPSLGVVHWRMVLLFFLIKLLVPLDNT